MKPLVTEVDKFSGPFYYGEGPGKVVLGFRVKPRHLNAAGICHGGVLATFADLQGSALKRHAGLKIVSPTISLSLDFLSPVHAGDWVEGYPELLKLSGRMLFFQSVLKRGDDVVARCNGIYKLIRDKA
ncbi:MAG: PaaI family thioesterase [Flavobacteriaceae bacterium]